MVDNSHAREEPANAEVCSAAFREKIKALEDQLR